MQTCLTSKLALDVWLPVTPVPAARIRVPRSKFARPFYPPRYEAFRVAARPLVALLVGTNPIPGPLTVRLVFHCHRPKKPTHPYPRGDIDNYVKAILDSLNKQAYHDDSQIEKLYASKVYAENVPGIALRIYTNVP